MVALEPFGLSPGRGVKCRPEDKKRSLKRKQEIKEKRKEGCWKSEVTEKKERKRAIAVDEKKKEKKYFVCQLPLNPKQQQKLGASQAEAWP